MEREIEINGHLIGPNHKPYVIAEMSGNHNGDLNRALRLIELAKVNGADAIKIQTYTADTITLNSDRPEFQIHGGLWDGYNLYQLYEEAHTPWEWHKAMFDKAREVGITIFSSPFDETAVDLLESLGAPAYKIASFELTHIPLIEYVAKTMKPIILSTGMATEYEIQQAVDTIHKYHNKIVLLHCVSEYPAPIGKSNLAMIRELNTKFNCISGLSDHSLGNTVAITSVGLGASVIEKHFTDDRSLGGVDHAFSMEPKELKSLVENANIAHSAIGKVGYVGVPENKVVGRRSIYFVKEMKAGDVITKDCIKVVRPECGLEPKYFFDIIGKKVLADVTYATPVSWDMIEK